MKSDRIQESNHHEKDQRQEREIAQSLKYASYIQQAIFPTKSLINKFIPEHFIFYQPREIVSGDFYYVSGRNDKVIIAVGDCTGHGVPGAFMSILGITFLNDIISRGNSCGAGSILNQMREHIMKALCQTGEETEQRDGVDLAMCILDTQKNILNYAGAFNPVYIIRDQNLIEIAGDKMPVGVGAEEERPFGNHMHELKNNDAIYLFTDGFADQFGGPSGKKFKYQPFRDMLIRVSPLPMPEQKSRIKQTFDTWKGNHWQLDDVLIFGFRYHASS
jgi:sigma-B regulation protein RsbU (phosphoserine phosphatase)